jgi:hypothetical protein
VHLLSNQLRASESRGAKAARQYWLHCRQVRKSWKPRPKNAVFFELAVCPKNDYISDMKGQTGNTADLKASILARIRSTPDSVWNAR